jgi:uncharacterized membrane protein YphA (DoxX/SURF4 family)
VALAASFAEQARRREDGSLGVRLGLEQGRRFARARAGRDGFGFGHAQQHHRSAPARVVVEVMATDETRSSSPSRRGMTGWRRSWSSGGGDGVPDAARMALVFAGLRIFVGVIWIANLSWKLPPDFGRHDARGLLYSVELAHRWALVGPLRDLVGSVVIPHFTLIGWLVFGIELSAGVLLTLGWKTRLGALLGTAESIAITLLVGRAPTEWFWGYAMFVVLNVLPLVVPADARLSIASARRTRA